MTKEAVKFSSEQIEALRRVAKENNLRGREILDEYTNDEIRESFNGAGSSAASEAERWLLTKILKSRLADVMIHDMTYRKGGSEEDFRKANDDLMYNISSARNEPKGTISSAWWDFVGRKAKEYSDEKGKPGWGKA